MFDNEKSTFTIADLVEGAADNPQNAETTSAITEDPVETASNPKEVVVSEQSILDFVVPTTDTEKEENTETKKVDYRALYNMRVEVGEFIEVEDADKLDWTKKETYDAIVKFHEKPEQSKSPKTEEPVAQNTERAKVIGEQKKFIEDLKADKFSTKEGYSQLIKYDYMQVKGLSEDEAKELIKEYTDPVLFFAAALQNTNKTYPI